MANFGDAPMHEAILNALAEFLNESSFVSSNMLYWRLIPTFLEETDKIINAQKSRCADFDSGNIFKRAKAMIPVLIPLIISAIKRADDLADAMDSRCYRGAKGRTRYKKMKLRACDVLSFTGVLIVFLAALAVYYEWFPFLAALTSQWWFV